MEKLYQYLILDFLKQEPMLREAIKDIELVFDADVVVYCGLIEPNLIGRLIETVKEMSVKKDKRKRLALMISSKGGAFEKVKELFSTIFDNKLYEEIYVIVNGNLSSSGTLLSFYADKLFVIEAGMHCSSFGMIDPQTRYLDPIRGLYTVSSFLYLRAMKYSFSFNDETENIGDSLIINDPLKRDFPTPDCLEVKESIFKVREIAFNALINHNLKDVEDKKRKAIKLINRLMVDDLYNHESDISINAIESMGLLVNVIKENSTEINYDKIKNYSYRISSLYNDKDCGVVADGNVLVCLLQTKDKTIF